MTFLKGYTPWNKGKPAWNKGKKMSIEFSQNCSERQQNTKIDEDNPNWKGDKVKYRGLHMWVSKKLGKANHCEDCDLDKVPVGMKRYFNWANISHEYKRDLEDWKQLCAKCHKQFDKIQQ